MTDKVRKLQKLVNEASHVVFFGGAGVSTESNIPDFRSEDGIFRTLEKFGERPETILSYSWFRNHTEEFFDYYRNFMIFKDAQPNAAHTSLARLERSGQLESVITQNIDGLHQAAGSTHVLELHGSVHRNYCTHCGKTFSLQFILEYKGIPRCDYCSSLVRPDVTLYEENLNVEIFEKAMQQIEKSDLLIVAGTSLAVYPAAGLIDHFKGSDFVLINKSQTPYDNHASFVVRDSVGAVLGQITASD